MISPLLTKLASFATVEAHDSADVRTSSRRTSAYTAVIDAEGTHTYAAIVDRAERFAAALLRGRESLDQARVAILVGPGADFVAAFFGVLMAGGTAVILSPLHPARESKYFCDDARVDSLVISPELAHHAAHVDVTRVTTVDARAHARQTQFPRVTARSPALQLYTSGTTGKPKGAVLLHQNLATQQDLLRDAWGFTPNDVLLHTLPLHHMHGLCIALMTCLGSGATARMMPAFDARATWDAMRESTVFMAVPTIYAKLLIAFDGADDDTRARWSTNARALRLATSGSAALPVSIAERWRRIAGTYPLERFGMTEIGVGTSNPLDGERRPGTVGTTLPSVKSRIVGEDGVDSETGELWIAGPSVFAGYFGNDDATRDAFVSLGGERWFKTGDTVTRDDRGYVKMLGRTSIDILKSGGYKLSALEIEEALRAHPAVAEVAVVGIPDDVWGDRVVACIVPRDGRDAECSEESLRAFAKSSLAPYKVPKSVVRMRELPRNTMGKVVKPELVARLKQTLE